MITWDDITLFSFQQMDRINGWWHIDELEKVLLITCEVFGLSDKELNDMPPKKANRLIKEVLRLSATEPAGAIKQRIGHFHINYDPASMTLGQFVEVRHFLQQQLYGAHQVMASLASTDPTAYKADGHALRADYFLRQPVTSIIVGINHFSKQFNRFLKEYSALFGLDKEVYTDGQESERFNKYYGWIYSATQIAEHERITLDQAFGLPIRQAFNDLLYLKALSRYQAEQHQNMMNGLKK